MRFRIMFWVLNQLLNLFWADCLGFGALGSGYCYESGLGMFSWIGIKFGIRY